jgi:hypothetical protein
MKRDMVAGMHKSLAHKPVVWPISLNLHLIWSWGYYLHEFLPAPRPRVHRSEIFFPEMTLN